VVFQDGHNTGRAVLGDEDFYALGRPFERSSPQWSTSSRAPIAGNTFRWCWTLRFLAKPTSKIARFVAGRLKFRTLSKTMRLWTSKQGGTRRRSTPVKIRHQTLRKSRRHLFVPSPQKIVPSPRKFTEDPSCDVQEPSERSRHTCGASLESSMLTMWSLSNAFT